MLALLALAEDAFARTGMGEEDDENQENDAAGQSANDDRELVGILST